MERHGEHYYVFGPFRLEPAQGRLLRDGLVVPLTPKTFATLLVLVRNHGRLVAKNALMQELWPDTFVEEANLTFNVSVLRKALGESAENAGYIETIPKRGYRFRAPVREIREAPKGIAVLPFSTPASPPGTEYFADGLHEALISELSQIRGLRVISRTSSLHFGTAGRPLRELACAFHFEVAVEGAVYLENDRVRIEIRLVDALEERTLWGHSYERHLRDVISFQRELAMIIARQIQVTLTESEENRLSRVQSVQPEALAACLRGRYYWHQYFTENAMQQAMALFQQAIHLDPEYAQPWAGLSACCSAMAVQSMVAARDAAGEGRHAAQRGLAADPLLPDAHVSIAAVKLFFDWDWLGAERAIATAIDLSPSFSLAHGLFTHLAMARGWGEQAVASAIRALELDPLSASHQVDLGWAYLLSGATDKAREQLSKMLDMDFRFPLIHMYLAQVYLREQRFNEALEQLEKTLPGGAGPPPMIAMLGHARAAAGDASGAASALEELDRLSTVCYVSPFDRAVVHAALRDFDQALDCLKRAVDDRSPRVIWLRSEPAFDELRMDSRFDDVVRLMALET